MNVVHIFKDCYPPTTGGIEQHMNLLCRRLAQRTGVTILAPSRSRQRREETLEGVRIIRVPEFGRCASVPLCPTAPFELHRLRPDIVHLHFPNPMGDVTQLLGAAKVPFVITYHADIIKQKIFIPLYMPILKCLFNKTSKILFSADENINSSSLPLQYRNKCAVVPFGIEIENFSLRGQEESSVSSLRGELAEPIILFVGAARYYKGIDILLQSMAKVNGRLLLAGRGTETPSLRNKAAALRLSDRVEFCGEVSQSRLRVLLNAADIFVLPSIDRCETFGIGQLEAMACSKPVVSTDLPTGVRSVNRHGVTGLVVAPGDPDALGRALNTLISNPSLREKFGIAGRQLVAREFGADKMVSKTFEIYHEILG